MSILATIGAALGGEKGLGGTILDAVKTYFPPDMTPEQKATLELGIKAAADKQANLVRDKAMEADKAVTDRIAKLEGSASDLLRVPYLGALIIFLRGCQRPMWGFATLYMDFLWFTTWKLTETQETALCIINFLVLGFLFGERTIKNLEPLIMKVFGQNGGGNTKGAK
ncbi:hypothetical protein [Maridesulfovibrio ferrireducens]|uniref:hypothetical protein n=1 Tax=Maridesulfovibrio ferrireducens TaxID=246191 RepID=UPI001A2853A0|nr:hypothetical protein [Maridesulfovibrio ferrireducens]MBI9109908.1 hypothetical protein [Maridesulfovibrio ferrireducens]